jgi:hypothetical protein
MTTRKLFSGGTVVLLGLCVALTGACGDDKRAQTEVTTGTGGGAGGGGSQGNSGNGGTISGGACGGAIATPTGGTTGSDSPRPPGDTIFARSYGDEGQQTFGGTATDDAGNVYAVGVEFPVTIVRITPQGRELGPMEGTSQGGFVVKYGPTGELLWQKPFPIVGDTFLNLLAVTVQPTTGAVILAGWVQGSLTVDGSTLTSGTNPSGIPTPNLFLLALDSAGTLIWSRVYPSPANTEPDSVFVTAGGDIEVVGRATDNATVGGGPICCLNTPFGLNTFVARYSPQGAPIWSAAMTGGEFQLTSADAAADGGLVVGGSLSGSMTFDGQTFSGGADLTDVGLVTSAGVVLRLDPAGHLAWSRVYQGDPRATSRVGAGFDAATNVILFGQFSETLDLGSGVTLDAPTGTPLKTAGLLAKLAPDGHALWARQFQVSDFDTVTGRAVAADAAGNIALVGETAGGLSLGGQPPLPAGTPGDFIAKFTPGGVLLWNRGFAVETSNNASHRMGVGFDAAGNAGWAGELDNSVAFDGGPITAPGETSTGGSAVPRIPDNVFVVKVAP